MTAWTDEELDAIGEAAELELAPARSDGTLRDPVTIWVVRHGDALYIRSWRGPAGRWYRAVLDTRRGHVRCGGVDSDVRLVDFDDDTDDAVDAAYRRKYPGDRYLASMVRPEARATTLELVAQR